MSLQQVWIGVAWERHLAYRGQGPKSNEVFSSAVRVSKTSGVLALVEVLARIRIANLAEVAIGRAASLYGGRGSADSAVPRLPREFAIVLIFPAIFLVFGIMSRVDTVMKKLACFVIPTFNEAANVPVLLPRLLEQQAKIDTHELHVLFVDDNSPMAPDR